MRKYFLAIIFIFSLNALFAQSEKIKILSSNDKNSIKAGEVIYQQNCMSCHKKDGRGIEEIYPPLSNSDYLLEDKLRAIRTTIYGSAEPIIVNDEEYDGGEMLIINLTNEQVRDVVNYILNSWGNAGGTVTLENVKAARKK